MISQSIAQPRFYMLLLTIFATAFALWSRLRPVVADPGAEVTGDDDWPPCTEPTVRRPAGQSASTVTGTRCTRLFAMPCRFQTCSVG